MYKDNLETSRYADNKQTIELAQEETYMKMCHKSSRYDDDFTYEVIRSESDSIKNNEYLIPLPPDAVSLKQITNILQNVCY